MKNWTVRSISTAVCLATPAVLGGCASADPGAGEVLDESLQQGLAYGGAVNIPGRIEAERYDADGAGVAYSDSTVGNSGGQLRSDNVDIEVSSSGGYDVGWITAGEWLRYSVNVQSAGAYAVRVAVAPQSAGGSLHLELNGQDVSGPIAITATGGWQTWTTVEVKGVNLPAGQVALRLVADASGFNIDYLDFQLTSSEPTCSTGILNSTGTVCCAAACGACGGAGCDTRPGGAASCCTSNVTASNVSCSGSVPPCVMSGAVQAPGTPAPGTAILAKTAAARMSNGFNVGNTFETNQHPRTAASVNAMIDAYYAQGFRTVRIPIRWIGTGFSDGDLANASGVVNKTHARLAVISAIVDHAISKGMFVVINTHHDNWLFDGAWATSKYAVHQNLWSGICDVFKDKSPNLMFEVMNEPHGSINTNSAVVRAINQNAYNIIRACGGNNPTRIVVLTGQDWNGPSSLQNTWPSVAQIPGGGNDPYVIGSIHFYDPLALTHALSAAGVNTAWSVNTIRTSTTMLRPGRAESCRSSWASLA